MNPTQDPNIQTVIEFNLALNRGDLPGMRRLLSAGTIFENTYPPPDGGRFVGQAAVLRLLGGVFSGLQPGED